MEPPHKRRNTGRLLMLTLMFGVFSLCTIVVIDQIIGDMTHLKLKYVKKIHHKEYTRESCDDEVCIELGHEPEWYEIMFNNENHATFQGISCRVSKSVYNRIDAYYDHYTVNVWVGRFGKSTKCIEIINPVNP